MARRWVFEAAGAVLKGVVVFRTATEEKGPSGEIGTRPACPERLEVSRRFSHRAPVARIGGENDWIA